LLVALGLLARTLARGALEPFAQFAVPAFAARLPLIWVVALRAPLEAWLISPSFPLSATRRRKIGRGVALVTAIRLSTVTILPEIVSTIVVISVAVASTVPSFSPLKALIAIVEAFARR